MAGRKKANLLARIGLGAIITVTPLFNGCEEAQINPNALIGALGTGTVAGARTPEQAKWGAMAQTYGTIAGSQPQVNVNVNNNPTTTQSNVDKYPHIIESMVVQEAPNPNLYGPYIDTIALKSGKVYNCRILRNDPNVFHARFNDGNVYIIQKWVVNNYIDNPDNGLAIQGDK